METKLHNQILQIEHPRRKALNVIYSVFRPKEVAVKKQWSREERYRIVLELQAGYADAKKISEREGIEYEILTGWTQEFLGQGISDAKEIVHSDSLTDDEKYRLVLEGINGESSVAEICRRQDISHDLFLSWSQKLVKERVSRLKDFESSNRLIELSRNLVEKESGKNAFDFLNIYFLNVMT